MYEHKTSLSTEVLTRSSSQALWYAAIFLTSIGHAERKCAHKGYNQVRADHDLRRPNAVWRAIR